MSERTLIAMRGVTLGYGGSAPVLSGLDLTVDRADFLGIVGPNGSGKTTILRGALGLLQPSAGTIERTSGVRFGYVPQRETLDENYPLSLRDVVLMGRFRRMGRRLRPDATDRTVVANALDRAEVTHLADSPFRDLSGGQKQRALIARAIAAEPDVLVLDEPTNGLDLRSEGMVMNLLASLHRDESITVILVSHLLNTVARWAPRIGLLHDGRLETGSTADMLTTRRLSAVYGPGVRVLSVEGEPVVVAGRGQER